MGFFNKDYEQDFLSLDCSTLKTCAINLTKLKKLLIVLSVNSAILRNEKEYNLKKNNKQLEV